MDIQPTQSTQPISDDQELAQALAGVVDAPDPAPMQFEETPTSAPMAAPAAVPTPTLPDAPVADVTTAPLVQPSDLSAASGGNDLSGIKKNAIDELKPLVDKLDLPADEKFDAYLLLIRSTDDKSLIGPAHEAAQAITDETRRAEALLDIIKEIDYLSPADDQAA